ncbi:MAG TPA: Calx-beta domain-containing protein, partial [Pyrinomonadaceae bacterium]|nr:Calx-beta domain-containing protein [Pyrinomonadaceae bacterium]
EFGSSASVLYGYNIFDSGADFVKFAVTSQGVSAVSSVRGMNLGSALKFKDGRLYGSSGRVIDPEAKTLFGTFNTSGVALAVDTTLGRVFFLSNNFGSGPTQLTAYDLNTFLPLGTVSLQGVSGTPRNLVRWGANGLAFSTVTSFSSNSTSQVYLIQSALVSDSQPIPSTFQFNASTYSTFEGSSSPVTVTVTRAGGVTGAASINYATSDGTATAGSDYTATSGTLNFADGELSKTFTIPILDDDIFEGNETINVTLSNPTGGPTLGTPATAVVTINDGESTPFVSVNSVSLNEGDSGTTPVTFTVTLSNRTTKTVTMNYATADGSATAGSDYVATSGTLTFDPLTRTKTITVLVNGDLVQEGNELFVLNLSNIVNASNTTYQTNASILDDDAPGLRFGAGSYSVNEADGRATLTVTRKGDTSGTATVNYQTLDLSNSIRCDDIMTLPGRAFARCDYATSLDTLTFGPGVTERTFTIPIINDAHVEGPESFQVSLSSATGAPLQSPSSVFVNIVDDDLTVADNPIFDSTFFVRQHYLDFLSREPEQSGLDAWRNVLNNCSDLNNNPACDRLTVSAAFFGSDEFRLKGLYVFLFYKVALNRLPSYAEITVGTRQVTGQTPDEVYQKKALFAQNFVQRAEFTTVYGTFPNSQFVAALLSPYGVTSIDTIDPANPDTGAQVTLTQSELVDKLNQSVLTRAQVVRAIVQSRQISDREFNGAFVAMQYYGYLRRAPETTGFQAWLNYLNSHPGDFRTMVNGFMNSLEYRLRFGVANP